ncbi:hypothetical protein TrVE_jg9743 [Triparma verrucosa]|uniref:Uncharacterized protein n=2 Tax=Triparma TaxID=722752 RepID=A0A9W7AC32_9STRA|nr:hypothetical protein TrST_g3013 [Triparma strigata]GMI14472.1 hypothetical protein TrVE_jg9743 [Triparma verrucosa]
MGPKKRDKVPIRKPISSFNYSIPLGTSKTYSSLKNSISLRMSTGYPNSLPTPDQVREEQKKKLDQIKREKRKKNGDTTECDAEEDKEDKKEEKITSLEGMKERYNEVTISKIKKEVSALQSKKKEFFWLLKQVITVEAQRKRTETVKSKQEQKPSMGSGSLGGSLGGMGNMSSKP